MAQGDKIIELSVVGVGFRTKKEERPGIAAKTPATATLEREPDNRFDPNAVKVIVGGRHLGYLPALVAEQLAPRLDSGEVTVAKAQLTDLDRADDYKTGHVVVTLRPQRPGAKGTGMTSGKKGKTAK